MFNTPEFAFVTAHLKNLGCSARESAVYIHLLQTGAGTVQEISKKLKQNRVTIHEVLERLIERNLVTESRKGKRRLLIAEEPGVLQRIIQKKETEISMLREGTESVIKLLRSLKPNDSSIPSVRYYEGVDGFKLMLEETLSSKGEVLVISNVDQLSEIVGTSYLDNYYQRRSSKGIHSRLIFPPGKFANKAAKNGPIYKFQVRFLPPELQWRSAIFSWNNCLSLKSFSENKITCTIIENSDISHFFRNILFELIWKQASALK